MPQLNHTGPEGFGAKTGRKLGNCKKNDSDLLLVGEIGQGMGKHFHHTDAIGKGKRINYYKIKSTNKTTNQ